MSFTSIDRAARKTATTDLAVEDAAERIMELEKLVAQGAWNRTTISG